MIGFPNSFSTKQDYYNVKDIYPEQTKEAVKKLMDGRFIWIRERELNNEEEGINDTTHKVIMGNPENDPFSTTAVPVQMKYVEDKNSLFYCMGWTLKEANEFIKS